MVRYVISSTPFRWHVRCDCSALLFCLVWLFRLVFGTLCGLAVSLICQHPLWWCCFLVGLSLMLRFRVVGWVVCWVEAMVCVIVRHWRRSCRVRWDKAFAGSFRRRLCGWMCLGVVLGWGCFSLVHNVGCVSLDVEGVLFASDCNVGRRMSRRQE